MAVSAAVAVLVVLLKPVVENWFEARKRRIVFRIDRPTKKGSPFAPDVKLKWGEYEFDEVFGYDCALRNDTGRTLRDVTFVVSASPGTPSNGFCKLTCGDVTNVTVEDSPGQLKWTIHFEEFTRGERIPIYVLSTVEQTLTARTKADLEIYSIASGTEINIGRVARVRDLLQGGILAAATAGLIAALLGRLI